MKVLTNVVPWWGQAALLVLGIAGTALIEYLRNERDWDANSDEDDDEQTFESKPRKSRAKRSS